MKAHIAESAHMSVSIVDPAPADETPREPPCAAYSLHMPAHRKIVGTLVEGVALHLLSSVLSYSNIHTHMQRCIHAVGCQAMAW